LARLLLQQVILQKTTVDQLGELVSQSQTHKLIEWPKILWNSHHASGFGPKTFFVVFSGTLSLAAMAIKSIKLIPLGGD